MANYRRSYREREERLATIKACSQIQRQDRQVNSGSNERTVTLECLKIGLGVRKKHWSSLTINQKISGEDTGFLRVSTMFV